MSEAPENGYVVDSLAGAEPRDIAIVAAIMFVGLIPESLKRFDGKEASIHLRAIEEIAPLAGVLATKMVLACADVCDVNIRDESTNQTFFRWFKAKGPSK